MGVDLKILAPYNRQQDMAVMVDMGGMMNMVDIVGMACSLVVPQSGIVQTLLDQVLTFNLMEHHHTQFHIIPPNP
jgi:hypothetical protein